MLSGHFQGRVLSMLAKLIRPMNILEIGTYTGYSALCLCEGMQENGILHTIDIKEELVDFQRKHFDKSPWEAQIIQHLGEAVDIIPTLDMKFDLVLLMPIRKTILIILISFFQNEQRRDYPF
jgi:predicted O-methyltransferase YrrM